MTSEPPGSDTIVAAPGAGTKAGVGVAAGSKPLEDAVGAREGEEDGATTTWADAGAVTAPYVGRAATAKNAAANAKAFEHSTNLRGPKLEASPYLLRRAVDRPDPSASHFAARLRAPGPAWSMPAASTKQLYSDERVADGRHGYGAAGTRRLPRSQLGC